MNADQIGTKIEHTRKNISKKQEILFFQTWKENKAKMITGILTNNEYQ